MDILIALGHSGYDLDQEIARQVSDIDIVVGGHSHTFLYPPDQEQPSVERPEGPYPTYVEQVGSAFVVDMNGALKRPNG